MRTDFDPFLPQPALDPANLHLLRAAALERVKREQQAFFVGVPAQPGQLLSKAEVAVVSRRWSLRALFALMAGAVPAGAVSSKASAALRAMPRPEAAVSPPQTAVYGGPVPRPPAPRPPHLSPVMPPASLGRH
jgi:hypothetical protein